MTSGLNPDAKGGMMDQKGASAPYVDNKGRSRDVAWEGRSGIRIILTLDDVACDLGVWPTVFMQEGQDFIKNAHAISHFKANISSLNTTMKHDF